MKAIELDYEVKTIWGNKILWEPGVLVTQDVKEYERMWKKVHQNPENYRMVRVKFV